MTDVQSTDPVDTHDPAGYAAFLRERAKANREIAALPREQWPYRPAVLQHWALRFDQGADLIEGLVADFEHMKKARDRDHEQAWMNGAAALRYRRALEAIAAFDPGKFRPLADEIAIWKQATDALQDDVTTNPTEKS